jgi:hypothetical protein
VFLNRVLTRIFVPKSEDVRGERSKLHNEELNDLYSSPTIIRVIKSRRIRWAGNVARMGEGRGVYMIRWENLGKINHWGDPDVDGRIILTFRLPN